MNLRVKEILCSFRLVLEGKTFKDITESSRSEFLGKFIASSFFISDAENNTSRLLIKGITADLPLLRTRLAIRLKSQEFLGSGRLFISICMYGSLKNPFATITSLSELYFRFTRVILLVQTKKVSLSYGSSASSSQSWRSLSLTWYLPWGIYTSIRNYNLNSLTNFTSSSRNTILKISFCGTS